MRPKTTQALRELRQHAQILLGFVVVLWLIECIDFFVFKGTLARFGIRPRNLSGLQGIFLAPFIHGDFGHLLANTVPLFVLGWLVMVRAVEDFVIVSVITMVVSGLGTWAIASPNSVHIGASGLVFGYFGFLVLRGYFERSMSAIAISLAVFFLYGSLIWGVLPSQPGISWQGHLFGFLGGVIAAKLLAEPAAKASSDQDYSDY